MLKIGTKQWFDLNIIGLYVIGMIMLIVPFYSVPFFAILLVEVFLLSAIYLLNKKVSDNKFLEVIINTENQWFVRQKNQMIAVQLKDYWLHTGKIFIWLRGNKKSLSFVVSRHIIGVEMFSQLRSKIV